MCSALESAQFCNAYLPWRTEELDRGVVTLPEFLMFWVSLVFIFDVFFKHNVYIQRRDLGLQRENTNAQSFQYICFRLEPGGMSMLNNWAFRRLFSLWLQQSWFSKMRMKMKKTLKALLIHTNSSIQAKCLHNSSDG